ncbi:hypothetical protein HW132_18310 [Brasilonema sp. CT11]|nr:hypothetical protein [Brasilonema sp. CT11]
MANEENFPLTEFERELKDMETTLTKAEHHFGNDQEMVNVIKQTKESVGWIRKRSSEHVSEQPDNLNKHLKDKRQSQGY